MSMLAEPRRKQKWSVDPRNSTWSKDESKFGQKMLERMGWSKGKGLGKNEQGGTEHVKVKVKNNSLGVGATVYNEDNWIAHQDDFNQLLAELNDCHGQNSAEEAAKEQTQGFSLEEKSKTSKKRVHYMKFTKGKDLSNRSETDLACIFGKRSKQARNEEEASRGPDSQEEKEQDDSDQDRASSPELHVTSALTMQEYFAQRMAQLKKGQSAASSPAASSNPLSPATSASTDESPSTSDVEQRKKKKKKKKNKKDDGQEDEEKVKEAKEPPLTDMVVDTEQGNSERKKKKKKKRAAEECSILTAIDDTAGDMAAFSTDKKKKKRKDKDAPTHAPTDSASEREETEVVMDTEVSSTKKKKRKRSEQLGEQVEVVVGEKKLKKDKKKKKADS
ncbi:PIN2/TERF1-interacting telomerase inhibitor 1 [Colossoma macropomum]|uniref:PIN2/TERF1-interacting telomerase inhibitor 1 n=1 Tax=Colossoma macropomum TaxID=42526 RepID=UPI001863E094|nr:PIN2/TERF1-interacting telomerase inhibitor 1 [Colossoma macropomum]